MFLSSMIRRTCWIKNKVSVKKLFEIFSVLSLCLLFGCSKQSDVSVAKDNDVICDGTFTGYVYKFRNLKNKEVWKTFKSSAEILAACQIPQDSLNRLNTEGLSQSCMFLPINFTYTAYYSNTVSPYDGILSLIKSCNCLTALTSKKLAPAALIKLYKNMAEIIFVKKPVQIGAPHPGAAGRVARAPAKRTALRVCHGVRTARGIF